MKVTQIYEIVNQATSEVLGRENVVLEDLTNIVDVGNEIFSTDNVDSYVKKLVNHIGKVIFDDRVYSGNVPSVLMDSWEFGSVLEKVSVDIPNANENDTWNLEDGKQYNQDVFYQPSVSAKFYNSMVTFEVPMSFTERQLKQSFSNSTQLNGFLSMLYNAVDKSMTIKIDNLIMKTINNMAGETLAEELTTGDTIDFTKSGVKAVNLLAQYNETNSAKLTPEQAFKDSEFIKYSTYIISLYKDRMSKISTLFNLGGKERFTPSDYLHIVLLTDFASASKTFLQSDTYNKELVELPSFETVPYWQGSGKEYDFKDVSQINIKTSEGKTINATGIIGVMFDRNSLGVCNLDKRVTSNYNAKAEFYTNFYKFDAGYFNDFNENFVVFFIA